MTTWLQSPHERPSETLNRVLAGVIAMGDAPNSIQSQARLPIYDAAVEILSKPKEKRRAMLDRIPALVRPYVEAEVIRLWSIRKTSPGRETKR